MPKMVKMFSLCFLFFSPKKLLICCHRAIILVAAENRSNTQIVNSFPLTRYFLVLWMKSRKNSKKQSRYYPQISINNFSWLKLIFFFQERRRLEIFWAAHVNDTGSEPLRCLPFFLSLIYSNTLLSSVPHWYYSRKFPLCYFLNATSYQQ